MLAKAHGMYKEGNVEGALLKYMLLAELGYEVAQSNVAYVFDQGTDIFSLFSTMKWIIIIQIVPQ